MADGKPERVDILIPLWGASSVEMFLKHGLPSLFAEGNLPTLARKADVTFVFLTGEADRVRIEAEAAYERLAVLCRVEFVAIDDLIAPGAYGMTITLAFARGLLRRGQDMTSYAFVLLMGDFVFAENALASLLDTSSDGVSAVFAPSYRVTFEQVSDAVLDRIGTNRGALGARDLADLAIDHLHSTVQAQFIDKALCHVDHVNQLYWRHDQDIIVSRQFLMHLFVIRPERPLGALNYFFDYGLFSELCPSGRYAVIDDSDQVLVLELQHKMSEIGRLTWGSMDVETMTGNVASWTCQVHRALAGHPLVLHRADLHEPAAELDRGLKDFVSRIMVRLPAPLPAADHPYWRGALMSWSRSRTRQGLPSRLSEFGIDDRFGEQHPPFVLRLVVALARLFVGERPKVSILHPQWLEYRELRRAAEQAFAMGSNVTIATFEPRVLAGPESAASPGREIVSLDHLAALPDGSRTAIMIDMTWRAPGDIARYVDAGFRALCPGGALIVSLRPTVGGALPLAEQSLALLGMLRSYPWQGVDVRAVGGILRRTNMTLMVDGLRAVTSSGIGRQVRGFVQLVALSVLSLMANLAPGQRSASVGNETMLIGRFVRAARREAATEINAPRRVPDRH